MVVAVVAVVDDDVADDGGGDNAIGIGGEVCVVASVVVAVVVWVVASFRVVGSASFSAIAFATSVTSLKCPSSIETQWP